MAEQGGAESRVHGGLSPAAGNTAEPNARSVRIFAEGDFEDPKPRRGRDLYGSSRVDRDHRTEQAAATGGILLVEAATGLRFEPNRRPQVLLAAVQGPPDKSEEFLPHLRSRQRDPAVGARGPGLASPP